MILPVQARNRLNDWHELAIEALEWLIEDYMDDDGNAVELINVKLLIMESEY